MFQNPCMPWFCGGINVLACAFCILSPTLQRYANFTYNCGVKNPKRIPLFRTLIIFFMPTWYFRQRPVIYLHFLRAHWNNCRLLEPGGTSEAVFLCVKVQIFKSNTLLTHTENTVLCFLFVFVFLKTQPPVYTSDKEYICNCVN